ncbi:hypothetical protein RHMOL_Rhmol11G0136200 [Rhododendron molle]|uniref:Uncharacterized protein n=1 Tax=Rhododendron molle TaxID=49168 RepID=A0ACC0LTE9_RHOML|nr:hypothetical protein RHMOL_Rhmol11G0136200 [Rhododendron molle]
MQFLGLFGIYLESDKIIFNFRTFSTKITLALSSLIFLTYIAVFELFLSKIIHTENERDRVQEGTYRVRVHECGLAAGERGISVGRHERVQGHDQEQKLDKGKMWIVVVIFFKLNLAMMGIHILSESVVVMRRSFGVAGRLGFGFLSLLMMLFKVFLFGLII